MSNKRLYVTLTDEREKMLDILASEFTKFYNNFGVPFGGSQDIRNAVILRFFLEGCRKYGFSKGDNELYFDAEEFFKALNYNPDKLRPTIEELK